MQNQVLELQYSNIIHLCKKNSQSNLYKQSVYTETNFSIFSEFQFLCSPGPMCETDMYISRTENLRSAATETDQIH
jgi:hypothetical protein